MATEVDALERIAAARYERRRSAAGGGIEWSALDPAKRAAEVAEIAETVRAALSVGVVMIARRRP